MGLSNLLNFLTFSLTHFIKHLVCIISHLKIMPPKSNKGKNVVGSSSSAPVSALSFLHPDCVNDFEFFCKNMIVMKQHIYDHATVAGLHIPEIVALMEHQEIDHFLKVNTYYNE